MTDLTFAPIAFAFTAGMVATVNPCGFAMLPAYVGLFLAADSGTPRTGIRAGLRIGLIVTAAFVATFVAVGAVFNYVTTEVVRFVPWAALVVGIVLAIAGIAVLAGRHLPVRTVQLRFSQDATVRSIALFGIAYAVASVSCTLPIFLSVSTIATTSNNPIQGTAVFAAYGLGMGVVLIALAVAVATSRDAVVRNIRRLMPYVGRIGGWLLIASGLFIVYYWTTLLTVDVTSDSALLDPILRVERLSAWFTTQIANNTLLWAGVLVAIVIAVGVFEVLRKRRRLAKTPQ